jgi:tRNA(Ile)-lysidine synthase
MDYNKAIRNRVIMKTIGLLKGDCAGIESKHIKAIWSLKFKESGRKINLPHKLYAQKIFNRVFIGSESSQSKDELDITLNIGKPELIGELVVRAELVNKFDIKKRQVNCEYFDFAQIRPPLFLRNRKAGEKVRIKNGVKKLKEILIEKKVPANERKSVLVLYDRDGILWILGIYRAYRAFIKKNTKNILKVEFEHTS